MVSWRATVWIQERVKERFTDEAALQDGLMGPWHVRLEALQALAFQHRDEELVAVALTEQDAPAVLDFAMAVALPASPALVEHRLSMRKAKPSMDMTYYYPSGNFLYAEAAIMKQVAASPMRLHAGVLRGFGLAGFTSAIPLLRRHAAISGLRTRAQALADGDAKAAKTELGGSNHLDRQWDGPSERGLEAVIALSRLGAAIDVPLVRELLAQTTALLPPPTFGTHGQRARARLAAVLFEADALSLDEAQAELADPVDLLTTLLRRGDEAAAKALAQSPGFGLSGHWFHYWPAMDFAMPPDFARRGPFGRIGADAMYPLSRDVGVAPPAWWKWRTPWTRSDSSRVLRGEYAVDEVD